MMRRAVSSGGAEVTVLGATSNVSSSNEPKECSYEGRTTVAPSSNDGAEGPCTYDVYSST